jgi:hypothetical protein
MDALISGTALRFAQKDVQRSAVLARLQADGACGAVPLPFDFRIVSIWKGRFIAEGLSPSDLMSVIEVRWTACAHPEQCKWLSASHLL